MKKLALFPCVALVLGLGSSLTPALAESPGIVTGPQPPAAGGKSTPSLPNSPPASKPGAGQQPAPDAPELNAPGGPPDGPPGVHGRSARKTPQGDPGLLGQPFPQNPDEAAGVLDKLFASLATIEDPLLAQMVTASIERIWRMPGGDTVNLLLDRASDAANKNNPDLALKLLDAAVDLAPDYADAWSRRAFVHYMKGDVERALGDLRRTLALEPNHFTALQGLAKILDEQGQKTGALRALEQLRKINPSAPGAKTAIENLKKEVEGQGI